MRCWCSSALRSAEAAHPVHDGQEHSACRPVSLVRQGQTVSRHSRTVRLRPQGRPICKLGCYCLDSRQGIVFSGVCLFVCYIYRLQVNFTNIVVPKLSAMIVRSCDWIVGKSGLRSRSRGQKPPRRSGCATWRTLMKPNRAERLESYLEN